MLYNDTYYAVCVCYDDDMTDYRLRPILINLCSCIIFISLWLPRFIVVVVAVVG